MYLLKWLVKFKDVTIVHYGLGWILANSPKRRKNMLK